MPSDFQLGEWIVRPQRDCIERDGRIVHIKPKSMAVLELLAGAAGEVVPRKEIFDAVWPRSIVTDDVLTQCIVELRRAFGDSARNPRYIETIPKVGFRILSEVTPLGDAEENSAGTARQDTHRAAEPPWQPRTQVVFFIVSVVLMASVFLWYLTGFRDAGQPTVPEEAKSLAILPFVDISENQDQGWYAYGLTEELTNRLAQLDGLLVTGRTSSYYFQDRNEDLRQIGEALGVNHLLEGSVRTDTDGLRVTAQLINASDGFHVWSKHYDLPRTAIFSVQEEIAESVAAALSIELEVGELGTMPGGTDSVEAYELLMLSKQYQWEATPDSVLEAIDCIKRAIAIDPDYARAWWRLAGMYINARSARGNRDDTDWMLLSRQALDRAHSLEPDLPGVKFLATTQQYSSWQWPEVEKTMHGGHGLELSSDFELISGWVGFLGRVGRIQEAIPYLERMRRLNPYSINTAISLGHAYSISGRLEESLAEAERAFKMDGFKFKAVINGMIIAMSTRDSDLLRQWLSRAEEHLPDSRELLSEMNRSIDDRATALAWLREAHLTGKDPDMLIPSWAAWHGDAALALEAMQNSPVPWEFWDSVMQEVRRLPGFKDLVRQVGLEEYFREYGWNDFCHATDAKDFECA